MNGNLLFIPNNLLIENRREISSKSACSKWIKTSLLLFALLVSAVSISQVGPAGVNSGIKLWLDASDLDGDGIIEEYGESGINLADSTVTTWRDKSGVIGGSHFTVPATYTSPKYTPNNANFDGLTTLDFSLTNALSHIPSSTWSGNHTIFIVFKQKGTTPIPTGSSIFSSGKGTIGTASLDSFFRIGTDVPSATNFTYHTTTGTGTTPVTTACVFGTQANAAANIVFYMARRSGNTVTTFVNGTQTNTMTSGAAGDNFDEYILNLDRDGVVSNNCYIAEVIIYDIVISGEARQRITDYLNCKYIATFSGPAPGGVDPCNIALWLRADTDVDTGGANVDFWNDQSNSPINGTQSGSTGPTYVPSDNNFNPSINFLGTSNENLNFGNSPAVGTFDKLTMGTNPFSIYSVAKAAPTLSGVLFSDNRCAESSGYRIRYDNTTTSWLFDAQAIAQTTSVIENTVSVNTNNTVTPYSLISFKRDGTLHTIQTHEGDVGTSTVSPALPLSATNAVTERRVGRRYNGGGCSNDYFDGNISEFIIVRSSVSAQEDKKIQSYLGIKYGLTIPSSLGNYLASDGVTSLWTFTSHWFDVAGIGQDNGSTLDQRIGKSQHPSAIVTMATNADFTSTANNASRTPVGDGNFLLWGNNNASAAGAWNTGGAPNDFAILPIIWRVKKTGTTPNVFVRVDVNDTDNNIPNFVGDLYLVHGPNLSSGTTVLLTEVSTGIWQTSTAINFSDSSFFTFAVRNDLVVEFSSPTSFSVDEQTMGTFPTVLSTGIVNVASSFQVNVVGGTATNAVGLPDYTYSNNTYIVNTGTYTSNVITLTPPTLGVANQDLISELNETAIFQIILGNGIDYGDVNGTNGAVQIHTMTITDDDSYQIGIGTPVNGVEGGASATFLISMVGVATNTSGAPITGTLTYSGSAIAGTDYNNTGQTTFTIAMNAPSTTVTLPITNDLLLEGTETIIVTIATVVGAVAAIPSDTTNIIDNEVTGLQITIGSAIDATEGNAIQFTVSLGLTNQTGSPITGTVSYAAASTAINNTDFTGTAIFSIANGASVGTVSSMTLPDNLVELTESVIAVISAPSLGNVHPTQFRDTAYIMDEDSPGLTISITSSVATVVENTISTIVYTVELDGGKINGTGSNIIGTVTLTGTASPVTSGTPDYGSNATFGFSIPNGASSQVITITIIDDGNIEPPETVIATISGLSIGSPNGTNNGVSTTILDDDSGGIFISIGSPTDTTESPIGTPFISFTVFIEGGALNTTGSDITGNIGYSGTASSGTDYNQVATFTIPVNQNSHTIQLPVLDNLSTEPTETVIAILSGVPSVGNYANTTSTADIFDDDASSLTISVGSPIDGEEGVTDVSFVVSLDNFASNGTGSPIFGTIAFTGAAIASDFTSIPPTIFSIPDGQSSVTITLPVFDDNAVEYPETVIATISSPNVGSISGTNNSSTATIIDNDEGAVVISISAPVDGTEGAGSPASFLIAIEGGITNGLGVPLTGTITFTGTASPSGDFENLTTFEIPDGDYFTIHELDIFDELNIEFMESIIATISSPLIGNISSTDTDTAYIFDNDSILAELNIVATTDGLELPTPTAAQFTVSLAGGMINELGIPITGTISYSGSAFDGSDYSSVGLANFSIPNSTGSVIIDIPILDDSFEEPTETIIATISSPSIGVIGTFSAATANILDGDTDLDNDGLIDLYDPNTSNIDSDCDGIFDGCDYDPNGDGSYFNGTDTDNDGINDGCDADTNNDGTIDNGPDVNNDGLNDVVWDPTDDDGDLLPNHVDPNDINPDIDGDEIPDGADVDANGDGVLDHGCDSDGDGIHNDADADDEPSDGITDVGNQDEDADGITTQWDPSPSDPSGQAINYIVSPNGDNVNETLFIPGIQFFENHELIIYNRWGTPVYRSTEYNNDWAGEIIEGIVIGESTLMEGTYYYTLDLGNGDESVKGYIEIRK